MAKKIRDIRRPEIVRALFDAVMKNGVSLPGYDQIATEGGMTRQLIRHYFKDPDELALALCNYLADLYREKLMVAINDADDVKRLTTFIDFWFNGLADKGSPKPVDDQVYDALFARAAVNMDVRENLKSQYELMQMVLSHEIKISYPDLSQNACRELGFLIVTQMYGTWKMVASLGFDEKQVTVARKAIDRLIASYVADYHDPDLD
ncbi:MAG: TetR/AcrR family transcriptional regulator [Paracoccaceae bacterium]